MDDRSISPFPVRYTTNFARFRAFETIFSPPIKFLALDIYDS
ncbi:hypothetical protein BRPE64_BCDS04480 [Caballeronia insecticola]|uniref:Uncharacterized protein n=1 Tax=Caballeronia insecticola TaxID=758793 RepID=R4WKX7_9BURK|nr:hypothetical protein BRPE64_BCDS04480 [Caballeronia insecticola]